MHLISELACGIAGAELGTAYIYRRGTSTPITYYADFEGSGAVTPTGAVDLDSHGGGVFYVAEAAKVIVRDAGGTTVREFVSASNAASVEVVSQSFTGTDYASTATGASKPALLSALLDLWKTNSGGAIDWKVRIAGVDTTLVDAFAAVGAAFVNVKGEQFGALGNGTADDTASIQEALDFAQDAGGGTVYFPPGTYKTTSALTVAANVSLLGAGPSVSIIKSSSDTADVLTLAVATATFSSIEGLRITYGVSTAASSICVNAAAGRKLRIVDCSIGVTSGFNGPIHGIQYDGAASILFVINSTFTMDRNAGKAVVAATTTVASIIHLWACTFTVTNTSNQHGGTFLTLSCGTVLGCTFDFAGITSTGTTIATWGAVTGGQVQAFAFNTVTDPASGTVTAPTGLLSVDPLYAQFCEIGNRLGGNIALGESGGTAAKSTYYQQQSFRQQIGHYYIQSDAAGLSVSPTKYAEIEIERTTGGAQIVTLAAVSGAGTFIGPSTLRFKLIINNRSNGAPTGLTTVNTVKGLAAFIVAAGRHSIYWIEGVHVNGGSQWVLAASQTDIA